jgi:IclR family transcriptional regulator, KDG regulon repressor
VRLSEVIRKSVKLLTALKPQEEKVEWSATEISRELDIPVQTVHRLLASLEENGVVFKNLETKKYRLGLNLLRIGYSLRNNLLVRNSAIPIMENLVSKTKESVYLTVPEGDEGVFIDCINAMQWLKMAEPIGMRVPLCMGASQKVILAYMNRKSQQSIIKTLNEKGKIKDLQKLKEDIRSIKDNRIAVSFEEITKGTASVAAPVFSWEDEVVASITVNGPKARFTGSQFKDIIAFAQRAAEEVSEELGWIKAGSKIGYK